MPLVLISEKHLQSKEHWQNLPKVFVFTREEFGDLLNIMFPFLTQGFSFFLNRSFKQKQKHTQTLEQSSSPEQWSFLAGQAQKGQAAWILFLCRWWGKPQCCPLQIFMCKCNSSINKIIDAKNPKVSMGFIHILTLTEKKNAARQLPTGAHLRTRNYELKTNFQKWHEEREIWPKACYLKFASKLPMGCHEQPELAQFTHLWLGISANTDCSSTARAGSRYVFTICQPLWPNVAFQKRNTFMKVKS